MSTIIASTYELLEKIGAGGGGNVYLANHIRLGKKVVLKADKRKITTRPELLRREVDILKDLSHSYIPQVYDFFVEDDIVYTAMDFIEGESLDRPLKRGERFPQAVVIKWAKQLLEALCYLHSPTHGDPPRGFVHSDIKPANIMRTPYGDICLIDFNIALALGEENVVGCSAGYASPEHYGLDYSSVGTGTATVENNKTVVAGDETVPLESLHNSTSTGSSRKVVPDVRSDIFSVGATLYHLLSGQRPAKDFMEIVPLSSKEFSPQIVEIISKAMNPNPDLRYQTAEEMLSALSNLHKNDPRAKRLKRTNRIAYALMAIVLVFGVATTFVGQRRMQINESWLKLSEYAQTALAEGDTDKAIDYALQAMPEEKDIFTPSYIPQSQKALTDALGVYDLSDGFKIHKVAEIPGNPLSMSISPEGKTAACVYLGNIAIIDTATAEIKATLPAERSALSEVVYLNETTVIYAGSEGITAYDISNNSKLWSGKPCTSVALSMDGKTVAAVYKDETFATVYNAFDGSVKLEVPFDGKHQSVTVNDIFANPNDNLFEINEDGNFLAVSFADGSLEVFDLTQSGNDMLLFDETSGFTHFEGGFYEQYFAFSGANSSDSVFAIIDTAEMVQTGGFSSDGYYGVAADADGIYVQTGNILVNIHPVTGEQTPLVNTSETIRRFAVGADNTLAASDESLMFFDSNGNLIAAFEGETGDFVELAGDVALIGSSDSPKIKIMKRESHSDADVFSYDASYSHDEARISADGKTVVLFSYDQFRVYDISGTLVSEVSIPDADLVYDQQFIRNGNDSYLEVTYNDGKVVNYSAKDGSVISETKDDAPDSSLNEVFHTDSFRFESPLHGAPTVYDAESGKEICQLSEEGYLTYVTQIGDYIVTQYITVDGYYYGLILNKDCETLAELPYLCDVYGDELYFDYPTGNVRKSRIYSVDELIKIAKEENRNA